MCTCERTYLFFAQRKVLLFESRLLGRHFKQVMSAAWKPPPTSAALLLVHSLSLTKVTPRACHCLQNHLLNEVWLREVRAHNVVWSTVWTCWSGCDSFLPPPLRLLSLISRCCLHLTILSEEARMRIRDVGRWRERKGALYRFATS